MLPDLVFIFVVLLNSIWFNLLKSMVRFFLQLDLGIISIFLIFSALKAVEAYPAHKTVRKFKLIYSLEQFFS